MIDLLESLVKSFKQTKKVLISRSQQTKFSKIDEYVLKQLICLLKPFKNVLQLIQTGNSPSLYMVLPCTLTLKKALSSFDELLKYQKTTVSSEKEQDVDDNMDEDIEILAESEGDQTYIPFDSKCLI